MRSGSLFQEFIVLFKVEVQEDFEQTGDDTLALLDDHIGVCDAVIHVIGDSTGERPPKPCVQRLLQRHIDFAEHGIADLLGCRADLDEAWEIAEPGPMRLHMADILIYRARFFRDKGALSERTSWLIERCDYWRRKEELEDAEAALA